MNKELNPPTKIKYCKMCGCVLDAETHESNFCECCQDDLDECNPFNQWLKGGDDS